MNYFLSRFYSTKSKKKRILEKKLRYERDLHNLKSPSNSFVSEKQGILADRGRGKQQALNF